MTILAEIFASSDVKKACGLHEASCAVGIRSASTFRMTGRDLLVGVAFRSGVFSCPLLFVKSIVSMQCIYGMDTCFGAFERRLQITQEIRAALRWHCLLQPDNRCIDRMSPTGLRSTYAAPPPLRVLQHRSTQRLTATETGRRGPASSICASPSSGRADTSRVCWNSAARPRKR